MRLQESAGRIVGAVGFLGGRPQGAASAGDTGPRPVWAVHGDELLPLAHLDCERLGPFGDHQVGAARHMRPPEAFAGRQLARTRDPPGLNVPVAC